MTTPTWLIAALFLFSLFQWMGNIRWIWTNYLDPAIIHINDPACHPPPLNESTDQYIRQFTNSVTQAATNNTLPPTWEPERAGIPPDHTSSGICQCGSCYYENELQTEPWWHHA